MGIVTDSTPMGQPLEPGHVQRLRAVQPVRHARRRRRRWPADYRAGGIGYGDAKKLLQAKIDAYFAAAREKRKNLAKDPATVEDILREGGKKARASRPRRRWNWCERQSACRPSLSHKSNRRLLHQVLHFVRRVNRASAAALRCHRRRVRPAGQLRKKAARFGGADELQCLQGASRRSNVGGGASWSWRGGSINPAADFTRSPRKRAASSSPRISCRSAR